MLPAQKMDFWHFLRLVFAFFLGGTILSMFALQLSPQYRETTLELVSLKRESRDMTQQFKDKDKKLQSAENKLRMLGTETVKFSNQVQAEVQKREEIKAALDKALADQKEQTKVIERMALDKTQTEKLKDGLSTEVETLKRDVARLTKKLDQEKKDCESKTFECETYKSDAESCATKSTEVKNELERLRLEHEQVKKEKEQTQEECNTLKTKLEEREEATRNIVKKVEQQGLEQLLDPNKAETSTKIEKQDLAKLLPGEADKTPKSSGETTGNVTSTVSVVGEREKKELTKVEVNDGKIPKL